MSTTARPLRLLLVVKGLDLGGIERIVVDLARGLRGRGVDVEVAVVNDARDQMVGLLEEAGVVVHRLGGSDRVGVRAAIRLGRLLARGRFGVVHVHGPLPAVVVRCLAGRTPVVTTSHTLWSGLRPETRVAWRATSRRDRATLAVSAAVAQSLPRRIAARVTVLPHGIDASAVSHVVPAGPDHPGRSDSVTAICVASHRDVKNYPNLLRAFAEAARSVPELRLVAVGDGPDRDTHRRLAADLGLGDRVRFEPAQLEVLSLIAAADLLVVASDFEGQPLVVLEAMALGVAVVATAVGRVPELVGPGAGRIVAPGDSRALAAAIVEVASDPELRRALGRGGRAASGSWTLDQVVDAHLDVYRSVCRPAG